MNSYITLSDVKAMLLAQYSFIVVDAKTGEDLTRSILLQIIVEEEIRGNPVFFTELLSQIIRHYGDTMQGVIGAYLEKNLQAFLDIQQRLAETSGDDKNSFAPEMWTQFMDMQGPMIHTMISNYIEQSKALFLQMQEQMQDQAKNMIDNFPFAQKGQV